jgi:lysophospholipase L1-like esterase
VPGSDLYIALGDATGLGLGSLHGGYPIRLLMRLRTLQPRMRLLNLCQSGARTLDVLQSQVPDAEKLRPALITIVTGLADVLIDEPEQALSHNLEEIAVRLCQIGAPVVMGNLPDVGLAPAVRRAGALMLARRIEVANEHIEATAHRHGFSLVDLHGIGRQGLAQHPEWFSPDGFHPSDAGYEAWTEICWPAVRDVFEPSEPAALS